MTTGAAATERRPLARRAPELGDVAERRASAHPQHHTHTTHSHKGNTMSDWFEEDGNEAARKAPAPKRKNQAEASDAETEGFFAEAGGDEETEDGGEDGGMADIEGNASRDAFYDGMEKVGDVVGTGVAIIGGATASAPGAAVGIAVGGAVGSGIRAGAMVGKVVGNTLDALADAADENAHRKHQKYDMKPINDRKDEEALKRINKGMKPGTGVTK
ncbi:MAG: hypothetical protein IT473_00715 [Lysobacter sp.]|nr:hypothetical protein [Lysobacter sp.]